MLRWLTLLTLLFTTQAPASAYIQVLMPLKSVLDGEQMIFTATVKEMLPDKPAMILTLDTKLKGEVPFERMPVSLAGDALAVKDKHLDVMLNRLEAGTSIVVFASKRGAKYSAFGFVEGTWFQMEGRIDKDAVRWSFLHAEPYLRRTYSGSTADLKQTITDGLAKKKEPPAPDEKATPGFGPEKPKKMGQQQPRSRTTGALPFAVIQLPFLGLIAALAALFPTVFGGLALVMRRWMILLSVTGFISTLYIVGSNFPGWIAWSGIQNTERLWYACAGIAALGGLCSARRYRRVLGNGEGDEMQARKFDRIALIVIGTFGIGAILYALAVQESLRESPWLETLLMLGVLSFGAVAVFGHYLRTAEPRPFAAISPETVMLWTLAAGCLYLGALERNVGPQFAGNAVESSAATVEVPIGKTVVDAKPLWMFQPPENGEIHAPALATADGIYVPVVHLVRLTPHGRVYKLNAETGAMLWMFPLPNSDDDDMSAALSAPVYADGKLYFGEGQHMNADSRLFCIDASTGKKLWQFATKSHTEAAPAVSGGKVVFGAGNDGVYCLDANTGTELWHYTGDGGIHVDANPKIVGNRVYGGSGLSTTYKVTRVFALDLATGKEIWGERTERSAYAEPVVGGGQAFFGIGNSTFSEEREPKVGGILCRDAATGKPLWERDLPHAVIGKPVLDRQHLYVPCWDGTCYALDRKTGAIVWKRAFESGPLLAGMAIQRSTTYGTTETVLGVSKGGIVSALFPATGAPAWTLDLRTVSSDKPTIAIDATPTLLRTESPGRVSSRLFLGTRSTRGTTDAPVARLYAFRIETNYGEE